MRHSFSFSHSQRALRPKGTPTKGQAVTQAVSTASGVWDERSGQLVADKLDRWKLNKGQHLAAASSAGTSLVVNFKHITTTLATWDAVWEVYLDPKWAGQRLRLYGAQDRALEQFFNKLEEDMAEVSMQRHGQAKQLVVFFGAATIGTGGGWGADAVLRACRKVVCRPRGKDQDGCRVVLVDEHRTSRVSSAVNGQQPCEVELNTLSATRPAGWKPPAGQVEQRLVRPARSQERGQPVRCLMWCPVVAPRKPPQAPRSSQEATQPPASEPGPSTPHAPDSEVNRDAQPEPCQAQQFARNASRRGVLYRCYKRVTATRLRHTLSFAETLKEPRCPIASRFATAAVPVPMLRSRHPFITPDAFMLPEASEPAGLAPIEAPSLQPAGPSLKTPADAAAVLSVLHSLVHRTPTPRRVPVAPMLGPLYQPLPTGSGSRTQPPKPTAQPGPVSESACIATLWTRLVCPESDWLLVNSECWTPGNHSLTQAMTQAGSQVGKTGHAVQDVVLMHTQQNTTELMDLFMEDVHGEADQSMEVAAAGGGQAETMSSGTGVLGSSDPGSILFITLSSQQGAAGARAGAKATA
ncbi:hypothetical protein QJQ45_012711 [Haematococcus lacustris]|nr:hypothetical protein QJQ45_012711 [Haematococcus lacustris]